MLDAFRELIDELLDAPKEIRASVNGLDPLPERAAGEIAALRDRDRIVTVRLRNMLQERPELVLALPDEQAVPAVTPGEPVLAEFEAARGDLVSLLMNLTLKQWDKEAPHDREGEITVSTEVERHVEFDERQLARITNALRSA